MGRWLRAGGHFRSGPQNGPVCVRMHGDDVGDTDSLYVRKDSCAHGIEVGCNAEFQLESVRTVQTESHSDYFIFVDSSYSGSAYTISLASGECP